MSDIRAATAATEAIKERPVWAAPVRDRASVCEHAATDLTAAKSPDLPMLHDAGASKNRAKAELDC